MILNQEEYGVKKTGTTVTIPNNSVAKLMYYLNSVCSLIPINESGNLNKLKNYTNYMSLSRD